MEYQDDKFEILCNVGPTNFSNLIIKFTFRPIISSKTRLKNLALFKHLTLRSNILFISRIRTTQL